MTAEPQRLWSVTTLIDAGFPKPALIPWASRVTAERAYDKDSILDAYRKDEDRDGAVKWLMGARWEKSGSAALRGTNVHSIIESYALGVTPDVPDELEPWHVQVRRFLDDQQPVFEAAESPVYNLEYSYAGTMDMILLVDGVRCIVDAKTTDKTPDARSRPPYGEVALQLAAYAHCTEVGLSPPTMRELNRRRYYEYDPALEYAPMPELGGAFALIISPVDYLFVPTRIDDEVWRKFLAAREVARFTLDVSKRVFGTPVTAGPRQEVLA